MSSPSGGIDVIDSCISEIIGFRSSSIIISISSRAMWLLATHNQHTHSQHTQLVYILGKQLLIMFNLILHRYTLITTTNQNTLISSIIESIIANGLLHEIPLHVAELVIRVNLTCIQIITNDIQNECGRLISITHADRQQYTCRALSGGRYSNWFSNPSSFK